MFKQISTCVVALVATVGIMAEDKKPNIDAAKLVGKYGFTSGMKFGKEIPADTVKKMELEITKDKITMPTPEGKFVFSYKVDATTTPPSLDLEILEGPVGKGMKSKGIIKADGDNVTIHYPTAPDAKRPTEFKGADGTLLFVLKKAK